MYNILKRWIGLSINKVVFKVWPPEGEENIADIDIRLCILFDDSGDKMYELSREVNDIWLPIIKKIKVPQVIYHWHTFDKRMKGWMETTMQSQFIYEYYEVNTSQYFDNIIGGIIKKIELIYINGIKEPFGIKIYTLNDYILSIPNADGSTIMTSKFNQNNKIDNFKSLGKVEYKSIT